MEINTKKPRLLYIDNLRLLVIILVVMVHLAVTYSAIGSWYMTDTEELGVLSLVIFGLFQSFTQAYFMGFLFLISGYFVSRSYDKRGFGGFIKERLVKLGIPTLIYMLIIHPFIVYVLLGGTWQRPPFLQFYGWYISSFEFIGQSGPLWFALALLIFSLVYAVVRKASKPNQNNKYDIPDIKKTALFILAMAIVTFAVRIIQPIDTSVLNMQLCFFTQYILMFIVGIRAGRYDWFSQISYKCAMNWLKTALIGGIVMWVVLMLAGGALTIGLDPYKGGFNWQSIAYSIWESFIAVGMSIGLITLFRDKFNRQSKMVHTMSRSAFAVYVFHPPIIILISLLMAGLVWHPLIKFAAACMIGIPISFVLAIFVFSRIPLLKRIL